MFCRNCGFQIGEQQRFCSNCGADNGGMGVGQSYNPMNTVSNPINTFPMQPVVGILGMKWYKFLLFIPLFVIMIPYFIVLHIKNRVAKNKRKKISFLMTLCDHISHFSL